jgi:hypothetical protein
MFDVLLLIVIAVGGVYVWKTGQERSRLEARYHRLAAITGDLKITDPTRLYFQALETDDPMHFAWRGYLPPNYARTLSVDGFVSSSSPRGPHDEFIGRVRFRANERGELEVYSHFAGHSSRGTIASGPFAKLLKDHWKELQVEQLGTNGLTVAAPDKTVTLLRIRLPDEFQAKAASSLPSPIPGRLVPVFYELKLGPDASKP